MQVSKNIYSVGAVDADVRIFHGYQTPYGTTYNSFLLVDDKVVLVDFVKASFSDVLLKNIKNIIGDRQIDYIICNHVEPDHSGALPEVVAAYPNAKIFGTQNCKTELLAYYPNVSYDFEVVKAGDTLKTANYTLQFCPMPMVHWPDSMATYLVEEKILFSNDAFGQHIGTVGCDFESKVSQEFLFDRAADYYANIVLPFGNPVQKVIEQLGSLPIELILPSHGVFLNKSIGGFVERYQRWSANQVDENLAVIVFDTMWGTTRKLAEQMKEQLVAEGKKVEMVCLSNSHHSEAMHKLLEAKYIFVGSSTLNNNILPTVSAFLTYMKGLKPKNRVGKAFGSCGWSGESVGIIHDILASCGFEMLDGVKVKWNC